MPDLQDYKARLLTERQAMSELRKAAAADRQPVELDQASVGRLSRIDAMQMQAMALEAERRRALRIRQIDAALQRLAEGEYGYCVACGEEIAEKRLALDPAAATCIDCAGKP